MILELATLNILPNSSQEFEANFKKAELIISSMKGYISHELHSCIETPNKYILLVKWENLESHTKGFRESAEYQEWKTLLHKFYHPTPTVEHYKPV